MVGVLAAYDDKHAELRMKLEPAMEAGEEEERVL